MAGRRLGRRDWLACVCGALLGRGRVIVTSRGGDKCRRGVECVEWMQATTHAVSQIMPFDFLHANRQLTKRGCRS